MHFLGQFSSNLSSSLSWFSSHFFTPSTPALQKRICKLYESHSRLSNIFTKQRNLEISATLPFFYLKKAKLKSEGGTLIFEYKNNNLGNELGNEKEKAALRFQDENQFNDWLNTQKYVGILEVKDERQNPTTIFYKLRENEEAAIKEFSSEQTLFTAITHYFETALWKLSSLDSKETIYIRAKEKNWSSELYFVAKNLEDLIHIVPEEQEKQSQSKSLAGFSLTLLLLTGGVVSVLKSSRVSNVAGSIQSLIKPTMALALSQLYQPVLGQQLFSAPYTTQASLNLTVYSNQTINFMPSKYFTDGNVGNFPIDYSVDSSFPSFLTYQPQPASIFTTLALGDSRAGALQGGGTLYLFGGNNNALRAYGVTDIHTRPTVISAYKDASVYYSGSLGFYIDSTDLINSDPVIRLATGSGYQQLFSNLPFSDSATTPATTNITRVVGQSSSNYFWFNDGEELKSGNTTGRLTSEVIASYSAGQLITDISLCDTGQVIGTWLCLITPNSLRIIDATNPTVLTEVDSLTLTSTPQAISCLYNRCYIAKGDDGIDAYDVSTSAPVLKGSYTGNKPYTSITFNGVVFAGSNNQVDVFNVTDPTQIIPYRNLTIPDSIYNIGIGGGNNFYLSTPAGVTIANLNNDTVAGTPIPSNRGAYQFNVTANNFIGGQTNLPVTLNVEDYAPQVANALTPITIYTNTPFSIDLSETFSDQDDPLSDLNIFFNGPSFVNYSNFTLQGQTSAVLDEVNITVTATDPFGKSAVASTTLRVTSGAAPTVKSSKAGLSTGAIVGIVIGAAGLIGLVIGGVILWGRLRKDKDHTQNADTFSHSAEVTNVKTLGFFGGNAQGEHQYALLNWDFEQIISCEKNVGLSPDTKGKIGQGAYGVVAVCWDVTKKKFMVMKTVEDKDKFAQSQQEAQLQRDAVGPGIWPVSNQMMDEDNNRLVFVSPPAEFGDLEKLSTTIASLNENTNREIITTYVAFGLLQGLNTLKKKRIVHCDIKGANVLVGKNGQVGFSDFGCGVKLGKNQEYINSRSSDVLYKSPEETNERKIIASKSDLWATGLTLLLLITGRSLRELATPRGFLFIENMKKAGAQITRSEYAQIQRERLRFIQKLRSEISEFVNAAPGSIWFVIREMLDFDPTTRLSADKALKASCFAELNDDDRALLFNSLFIKYQEALNPSNQIKDRSMTTDEVEMQTLKKEDLSIYGQALSDSYATAPAAGAAESIETPDQGNPELQFYLQNNKLNLETNENEPFISAAPKHLEASSSIPPRNPRNNPANVNTEEVNRNRASSAVYSEFPEEDGALPQPKGSHQFTPYRERASSAVYSEFPESTNP